MKERTLDEMIRKWFETFHVERKGRWALRCSFFTREKWKSCLSDQEDLLLQ